MDIQCFADALSDGHSWIERVERILENHLKLPPKRAECAGTECGDILSVEHDSAARGLQKTQDGPSEGAFAAAAFADQAHGFPGSDLQRNVVHRLDGQWGSGQGLSLDREMDLQVLDFKEWHWSGGSG